MMHPSAITQNPLVRWTVGALPARMKRIVFLASLTAIAKDSNVPEKALIHKLNEVLHLSSTGDAALKFPIHVSQLIWADKSVYSKDIQQLSECTGTEKEAVASAEKIASALPEWFRYNDVPTVVKDIMALFKSDSCIFPAART